MSDQTRRPGGARDPERSEAPRSATPAATMPAISHGRQGSVRSRRNENTVQKVGPMEGKKVAPTTVVGLDGEYQILKLEVQPDERGRLTIGQEVVGDQRYRVLINAAGQILLDPVVTIPTRELWLFQNHAAFASVARGVQQAVSGQVKSLGSFAQYAEDCEDEDDSE